jgi:nanoRNase/pAp phosphatase (c-di-AMP/oligoRNAs hydrolase)
MEGKYMAKSKMVTLITDNAEVSKQKKTEAIFVKVSPEERAKIERNMALIGVTNISAFVRRMCLDGGIFKVDMPEIQEVSRLMSNTANNVNQIAKRVNSGGHAYREDVAHVDSQLTECRELFGQIMARLAKM